MGEARVTAVECANGHALDESASTSVEKRQPCPLCGSLGRNVSIHVEAKLKLHTRLDLKAKRPGLRKPFRDISLATTRDCGTDDG